MVRDYVKRKINVRFRIPRVKDSPVSQGRVLHVKRFYDEYDKNKPYYTLVKGDGKIYACLYCTNNDKKYITFRCKGLESLARKIAVFRAKNIVREGVEIDMKEGFSKKEEEVFYEVYEEKSAQLLLKEMTGIIERKVADGEQISYEDIFRRIIH